MSFIYFLVGQHILLSLFFSHLVNTFYCRTELLSGIGFICLIYNVKTVVSVVGSILYEMLNYEYF